MNKPANIWTGIRRTGENWTNRSMHKLHPYPGIMRPEVAERFLLTYAKAAQTILDPFVGSGTTLLQANQMNLNSIGIDVCGFSCVISRAKTQKYDLTKLKQEITNMCYELGECHIDPNMQLLLHSSELVLFCRTLLPKYQYQDLLKTIISKTLFSLYYSKQKEDASLCFSKKLKRNSFDAFRKVQAFQHLRTDSSTIVVRGDSRRIALEELCGKLGTPAKSDFIFTSPPYIGKINYHAKFSYVYELFDIERHDEEEIGSSRIGEDFQARRRYVEDMIGFFSNMRANINPNALVLVIVEDRFNLWPKIARGANLQIRPVLGSRLQSGEKALLMSYQR